MTVGEALCFVVPIGIAGFARNPSVAYTLAGFVAVIATVYSPFEWMGVIILTIAGLVKARQLKR
jgi:hypothetical protein